MSAFTAVLHDLGQKKFPDESRDDAYRLLLALHVRCAIPARLRL
jgi:hypothetical protein